MAHTGMSSDPVERVWAHIFTGDEPANVTLTVTPDGHVTVRRYTPDGGTRRRELTLNGKTYTVDVPTMREDHRADAATVHELADKLDLQQQAEDTRAYEALTPDEQAEHREREAGWESYFAKEWADRDATRREETPLGPLNQWLNQQQDTSGFLADIAAGRDHTCTHCDGQGRTRGTTCTCVKFDRATLERLNEPLPDCSTCAGSGWAYDVCVRCAGTTKRTSVGQVDVTDLEGNTATVTVNASKVELTRIRTVPPTDPQLYAQKPWTSYQLSVSPLIDELRAAGLTIPDGNVLLDAGGSVRPFDGTKRTGADADPATIARTYLRLIPGGVRPDIGPDWWTALEHDGRHRCTYDDAGRVRSRHIKVLPPRPLTDTFADLTAAAGLLEAALPDGWTAAVSLTTRCIATGEHGPQVDILAFPPGPDTRPVAAYHVLDHDLVYAFETVAGQVRDRDLDKVVEQVLVAGS